MSFGGDSSLQVSPAEEINRLHFEIMKDTEAVLEKAILAGELLSAQKDTQNDWITWVESSCNFSLKTAYRYVGVFEYREDPKFVSLTNLNARFQRLRSLSKQENRTKKVVSHTGFPCKDFELYCCDLRSAPIKPGSIDVIITDPPYPKEFIPCYRWLAECASRWLKPGGSLLAMAGHTFFPEVLSALCSSSELSYHWLLSYLTPGGQSVQIFPRKVNTFWKPVVWMVKGEYTGDWIGDVPKSAPNDNDKRFHNWGQSESGFAELVTRFSLEGETILDPFCGGGTTGLAALSQGRRFIGIDCDQQAITTTRERLDA